MNAPRLLATRSLRAHRKAWSAVSAALLLTSFLLSTLTLAIGSAGLGHPRTERYADSPVVVTGDQTTRYTAKPWGSDPRTASAALTERVRVPHRVLDVLARTRGVRAAVPDVLIPLTVNSNSNGTTLTATGRPWPAARLAPHHLRTGRAPQGPHEVVAAGGHVRPGERIRVTVGGRQALYTVVGTATGPNALYFTPARAQHLADRPGFVAVGVLPTPGVPTEVLHARVRHALDTAGLREVGAGHRAEDDSGALRVLTGTGRGAAEHLSAAPARSGLLNLLGAVAATLVMVALLVIASLIAQALQQRRPELRLLRSIGATPRQVRRAVGLEVSRTAGRAALLGAAASVPAFLGLWAALPVPATSLRLPTPGWLLLLAPLLATTLTVGIARLAALPATGSATRARSTSEGTSEGSSGTPSEPATARRVTGLILLLIGIASAGTAATRSSETAAAAAGAAAVTMTAGCALLGPWLARGAMRVLDAPLRRFGGPGGYLAAAGCAANSRRLGAAITPIVLVTAFAAVQLGADATSRHQGAEQAAQAMRADTAISAPGGLDMERVRELPGVEAATEVLRTTVVLPRREAGEPTLDRLPALGVSPSALPRTLDPEVVAGSLKNLTRGSVAVGRDRARSLGLRPGSSVRLRFGDGAERELRVAAIYERALALGEFLFSAEELTPHLSAPKPTRALLATSTSTSTTLSPSPDLKGYTATPHPDPIQLRPDDAATTAALGNAAVLAIAALTLIAVLSTLTLIIAGRRAELALLRQVGATRAQLDTMLRAEAAVTAATGLVLGAAVALVPLAAFSFATARSLPWLPPHQVALIAATVAATTYAGTVLAARRRQVRTATAP
jgi:putative ABC transport system permease protein